MEKLIESRGQYDELRYKVGEELRTIQNVKDLLGGDCIKEEYNKYIKALHALKRVFVFSVEEKEEASGRYQDNSRRKWLRSGGRRGFLHRCNRFSDYSITGSDREIGNGIERFRTQKHDGRLEKLHDPDV